MKFLVPLVGWIVGALGAAWPAIAEYVHANPMPLASGALALGGLALLHKSDPPGKD